MFECAEQLMIDLVDLIPVGVVTILILNIISDLLFNR